MGDIGSSILNWIATINYEGMKLVNDFWWTIWAVITFIGALIGMAPLKTYHEHKFHEVIFVHIRKLIVLIGVLLILAPFVLFLIYGMTVGDEFNYFREFSNWFVRLAKSEWYYVMPGVFVAFVFRFMKSRYFSPFISNLRKGFRKKVVKDKPTDIREESSKHIAKDFNPLRYHDQNGSVFMALDGEDKPIFVPLDTWYETNMQVIGPTRYGKGVLLGNIMYQSIVRGDALFYVDPKKDKFAPHVMYQACKASGRKFYYLTLHDGGIGKWAPFIGGHERDGLARLERAFGLEFTGDPGTDYYKSQERQELVKTFKKTRNLESLLNLMEEKEDSRITAELNRWKEIESLRPKNGKGFSIEKALKENAVVYMQGHLDDDVVKTATKVFIVELIQEARRLEEERTSHLTAVIDEVSFLVSKELAQALATAVGFRVNFVLAYQSQNDLLNIEDKTVNARYVHNSINVNSQIKAVYGGADEDTAKWVAGFSGTISKNITKIEKADISSLGGESWEAQRAVGPQEENFINTNTILSLPPRVCVFKQPRHLAVIGYTAFVPVADMGALKSYISHKEKVYGSDSKKGNGDQGDEVKKEVDKKVSNVKVDEKPQLVEKKDAKSKASNEKAESNKELKKTPVCQPPPVDNPKITAANFLPPKLKSDSESMAILESLDMD